MSENSSTDYSTSDIDQFPEVNIDPISITVQEENQLMRYTESHFNTQIYNDLDKLRNTEDIDVQLANYYIRSNSPITISQTNSKHNSSISSQEEEAVARPKKPYRRLSYRDIEKNLDQYYDSDTHNKYSSEIDILTTYVKGQKHLYVQSNHLMQWRLNCLMVPALFVTASITIIAPFIECQYWSGGVISTLNALVALFISLINYLKLESSVEMYLQMANHYDKLETSLEMANSKLIFLDRTEEKRQLVLHKIKEVEKKMAEMKESNSLLIPEEIKQLFPVICHINIFLFIKKMEVYKKSLLISFCDIKNEIRYLTKHCDTPYVFRNNASDVDVLSENVNVKTKSRLLYLYKIKAKLKKDIIEYRSAYGHMDDLFSYEIKMAETRKYLWCWRTSPDISRYYGKNPVIDNYFHVIFHNEPSVYTDEDLNPHPLGAF